MQQKTIKTFKAMAAEIITKEDLELFREKLLQDIKGLLAGRKDEPKKWLKTYQVKNLLKISNNTLQVLRDSGTIPFTKVGGILYYKYEDIMEVLENKKQGSHKKS